MFNRIMSYLYILIAALNFGLAMMGSTIPLINVAVGLYFTYRSHQLFQASRP